MMFDVGDIVQIYAPTAGKNKYHLCVCCANVDGVEKFLFINSGSGYKADFVVKDGEIDGLPKSPTGDSIISCSIVVRHNQQQLKLYKAKKLSVIKTTTAKKLILFISESNALPLRQREEIKLSLEKLVGDRKK
ncbi:MAG: hypothetical protein KDJ45_11140 [Hyphomicrobiaceae bacterium]|nr:hypothetical protein [Hyphomicrobiaceae bacterium]MCC0009442.1 hypothetical protein [Hyphomicrobiaceae bacterium]